MAKHKRILVPDEFVVTLRSKYPFAKSLAVACQKLNEELKWNLGVPNDKLFNIKKR